MDGRQGAELTRLVRPGITLPVHFDDYRVFKSPLSDYLSRAREHDLSGIQPIERGHTITLPLQTS